MRWIAAWLGLAGVALAEDAQTAFVESNILGIFYHELGHAVIDVEGVPIFAQEEDAADVFSILLIHEFWEPDAAEDMAYHTAGGFWAEAISRDDAQEEIAWWAMHSPDERRYFNTVCLFYGAAPDEREEFADDLGLPEERAQTCGEEFDQAYDSWGAVLDAMAERGGGETMTLSGDLESLTGKLLVDEVAALNAELSFAQPLEIRVESCDEANAFYNPNDVSVTMCLEFEDHLVALEKRLNE